MSGFDGETFAICHSIKSGKKYSSQQSVQTHDLVVIGAGISGLTAAYMLKDKLDVKIIEKESRPGGSSKRSQWKGIFYSQGAADTGPTYNVEIEGKNTNFLNNIFHELNIHWTKVPDPTFAFKYENQLIIDPLHNNSTQNKALNEVKLSFEEAQARIEKLFEEYGRPIVPIEALEDKTLELDKKSLGEMFEGVSKPFRVYLEIFSSATFGAPTYEVSALKGLYYLSREMGERYTCPGGNACVSEELANRLKGKIELNSTVVSVEQKQNSYCVTYLTINGLVRTLECKAVVWASEKHYAPYIIRGLPKDQENAFRKVRYSSFIVANVLVKDSFYNGAFATYFDNAFFADLVIANWATKKNENLESHNPVVYTLYCPVASKQRHKVLVEPAETWGYQITESLEQHFGHIRDRIAGIRLYRYGHHYVVSYPGFISSDRKVVKRPFGNIFFAKDDTQGIPSLESAVWSGTDAAIKVLEKLK